jgi:hypothetical protein
MPDPRCDPGTRFGLSTPVPGFAFDDRETVDEEEMTK